jgi:hypothetical protein
MIVREARRACGALGAGATGDPVRLSICHCLDCKRRSGAIEVYEERRCPWLPDLGTRREF